MRQSLYNFNCTLQDTLEHVSSISVRNSAVHDCELMVASQLLATKSNTQLHGLKILGYEVNTLNFTYTFYCEGQSNDYFV